jgi:hypothetical protein
MQPTGYSSTVSGNCGSVGVGTPCTASTPHTPAWRWQCSAVLGVTCAKPWYAAIGHCWQHYCSQRFQPPPYRQVFCRSLLKWLAAAHLLLPSKASRPWNLPQRWQKRDSCPCSSTDPAVACALHTAYAEAAIVRPCRCAAQYYLCISMPGGLPVPGNCCCPMQSEQCMLLFTSPSGINHAQASMPLHVSLMDRSTISCVRTCLLRAGTAVTPHGSPRKRLQYARFNLVMQPSTCKRLEA